MDNVLNRISKLADNESISIGALEKLVGASKGVFSRAIANGTDVQSKWIQRVVENYPHYSARWLLTGEGEMLYTSSNITPGANMMEVEKLKQEYALLQELCDTQRKLIKSYEEQISGAR